MDFVEAVEKSVGSCDALIAIIGPQWLTITDGEGRRRLDNPEDILRLEVGLALRRRIPVIPVLVDGATMPTSESLPADLQRLTRIQVQEVSDNRWDSDIDELIHILKRLLSATDSAPAARPVDTSATRTPATPAAPATGLTSPPATPTAPVIPNAQGVPARVLSPTDAAIRSALISGWGQIALGQKQKGWAILGVSIVLAMLTQGASVLITWPLAIHDAYAIAKKIGEGKTVGDWEFF